MTVPLRLTLVALLWLILVNPGSITNMDTSRRLQMAHAWWTGGEERLNNNKLIININSKNYVPYDLGQSMLMLPGDWLGTKLSQNLNNETERTRFREAVVSFVIFLPLNLLAVLSCFRLLKLFGYSQKLAEFSSVVWLLCTTVFFYTTFHQQNNQTLLFVLLGYQTSLAYIATEKKNLAIFSGVALGIAFLIRITNILHVSSLLLFLIGCVAYKYKSQAVSRSLKAIFLWMTGFVPIFLFERTLNFLRYGSWTATSASLHLQVYAKGGLSESNDAIVQGKNNGFSILELLTKVDLETFLAPLYYPEKSIFLFDPLLLPCLIICIVCWRYLSSYIKWYSIAVLLGFLLHLYVYSWTSDPIEHGGWGARYQITSVHLFLIPLIPLLIRAAVVNINKTKDARQKILCWIARIIIIWAMLLQFASVSLHSSLESTQQQLGIASRVWIFQRFNNISANIKGTLESNLQASNIEEKAFHSRFRGRTTWNLLPFLYQDRIGNNSTLNKFIPILFLLWILIFILAIFSTAWIFVKY